MYCLNLSAGRWDWVVCGNSRKSFPCVKKIKQVKIAHDPESAFVPPGWPSHITGWESLIKNHCVLESKCFPFHWHNTTHSFAAQIWNQHKNIQFLMFAKYHAISFLSILGWSSCMQSILKGFLDSINNLLNLIVFNSRTSAHCFMLWTCSIAVNALVNNKPQIYLTCSSIVFYIQLRRLKEKCTIHRLFDKV